MLTLLCLAPFAFSAGGISPADTVVPMPEVVITATKLPTGRDWSPSHVTARRILGASFEPAAASAGSAVLGMPGLFIRSYGGAEAIQTLSVRGTGAEQSLVLLDGVPVTNRQSGLTDLSTIPAALLEGAELRRGGGSSLFGSEAVGGVLNLTSRSPRNEPYLEISGSTASYGGASLGFSLDQPVSDEAGLAMGAETATSSGNYPYLAGGRSMDLRRGTDMRSLSAYATGQLTLPSGIKNKLLISLTSSDKGTPGPVYDGQNPATARQADRSLFISDAFESRLSGLARVTLAASFRDSWLRYQDEGAVLPIDNFYRNQAVLAAPAVELNFGLAEHLLAGAEFSLDRASGNALEGEKDRRHGGLFVSSSLGAYPLAAGGPAVAFFPSLRLDDFDAFGTVVSAGIGLSIGSSLRSPAIVIHSTLGNNFRAPTFNELYYAGGGGIGNPGLGAERSTSFDCGVSFRMALAGAHELDVTYYRITTDDRIIWTPLGSPFVWTAANVGTTRSQGIEVDYDWQILPERLSLSANYTTTDATRIAAGDPTAGKQLLYVPLDEGAFAIAGELPLGALTLLLTVADYYTGIRYTAEDGTLSLPAHHLLDANAAVMLHALGAELTLRYVVHNARDVSYQVLPDYPMPMRNQQLSIHLGHRM